MKSATLPFLESFRLDLCFLLELWQGLLQHHTGQPQVSYINRDPACNPLSSLGSETPFLEPNQPGCFIFF